MNYRSNNLSYVPELLYSGQGTIIIDPENHFILSTVADNIKSINSGVATVIGTEGNISTIEERYMFSACDQVVAFGDGEVFENSVSNVAERTTLSSAEAIFIGEWLGNLTTGQASVLYRSIRIRDERFPRNYNLFKEKMGARRILEKIKQICKLLYISVRDLKNVFKFQTKNKKN